jgi:hypothetical protein
LQRKPKKRPIAARSNAAIDLKAMFVPVRHKSTPTIQAYWSEDVRSGKKLVIGRGAMKSPVAQLLNAFRSTLAVQGVSHR